MTKKVSYSVLFTIISLIVNVCTNNFLWKLTIYPIFNILNYIVLIFCCVFWLIVCFGVFCVYCATKSDFVAMAFFKTLISNIIKFTFAFVLLHYTIITDNILFLYGYVFILVYILAYWFVKNKKNKKDLKTT